MRISIASGKGGTGKTLVSTNLAWLLAEQGHRVTYADVDVEEPNGHLFLKPESMKTTDFTVKVPQLKNVTCSGCAACQDFCNFNAIIAAGDRVLVFNELCHACGGCLIVCPDDELIEVDRKIGVVHTGRVGSFDFISGLLDVGEAKSVPLIEGVIDRLPGEGFEVVDSPPGTSCSAMASVRGTDLVILVTEPTPFGLHDLKLAVGMVGEFGLPVAAIINRSDLGDRRTLEYLQQADVPILAEIPFSREIAAAYSAGKIAVTEGELLRDALENVVDWLKKWDVKR
jgi:MinD superfamily P-loop ATPase